MQRILLITVLTMVVSCGRSDKKNKAVPTGPEILEELALANGLNQWNQVLRVDFTFNVELDTIRLNRSWQWHPKTNDVMAIMGADTLVYNRSHLDSTNIGADAAFINDKFWLLAPINMYWDRKNLTPTYRDTETAPISGQDMHQLTVVYGNTGGYTPGDAYDLYFGDDFMVREWAYRKGNSPDPDRITTWEDYTDLDGLHLSRMHRNDGDKFRLYFTGLAVRTSE